MTNLFNRWGIFLDRAGYNGSNAKDLYEELRNAYGKSERFYHTLEGHIGSCIDELDFVFGVKVPLTVEAALWMHDVCKDEAESVCWMKEFFGKLWFPESFIDEVGLLIEVTKHLDLPHRMLFGEDGSKREYDYLLDIHAGIVADADLSIFGKPEAIFDEYERLVRKEYLAVPEDVFRVKRAELLEERFLKRKVIYNFRPFREKYEIQARKNLKRSIARLRKVGW